MNTDKLTFGLADKPEGLPDMRKKTTVQALFVPYPFTIITQEGPMKIGPDTVDDWDNGYYVLWPSDGTKPYTNSPKFFRENYVLV